MNPLVAKYVGRLALTTAAVTAVFFLFILAWAWLFRPAVPDRPHEYDAEAVARAQETRDERFDSENPPEVFQWVDYSEGENASWFPRGEAPVLAELVEEGHLPPVHERVGPEPVVLKGVDGIGNYGGTWTYLISSPGQIAQVLPHRLSYPNLVRWTHYGHPIVPHLARDYEVSEDAREFTFYLRRGVRWSDGHPFTADDIMFWYEMEAQAEEKIFPESDEILRFRGERGTVEKVDDFTVVFRFPEPNGLFIERMASYPGLWVVEFPAHFLRQYHPDLGDAEVIEQLRRERNLPSARAVYRTYFWGAGDYRRPRLWPWIERGPRTNPPYTFVRNPYFFAVDTEGNQLPYFDRLLFDLRSPEMISVAASNGEVVLQPSGVQINQYTLLVDNMERNNYKMFHWMSGDRSPFVIQPNLNRRPDPRDPASENKRWLFNQKEFRQALSLAINRANIIQTEYMGLAEPAQAAPPPQSPFFHERLYHAFTEFDPERAGELLDAIGLTQRDREGYRTFPDGTHLQLFLNLSGAIGGGPGQALVENWADIGLRVTARERSLGLFRTEVEALQHDLSVWGSNGEYMPLLEPRMLVPSNPYSDWARAYAFWFRRGGLHGDPAADGPGAEEPPPDSPIRRSMELYDAALGATTQEEQVEIFSEVMDIAADNLWTISVASSPPRLVVTDEGIMNVPRNAVHSWDFFTPGNTFQETYSWIDPFDAPGAREQVKSLIINPTAPRYARVMGTVDIGKVIQRLLLGITAAGLLMVGFRHPYVGRRLLILVPTLFIISVVSFIIIQLPPGDFLTTYLAQLEEQGGGAAEERMEEMMDLFHYDAGMVEKYVRWLGVPWFVTFEREDRGLLQGFLGRSMETGGAVNDIVGDRVMLTVLISFGTIIFTWLVAFPIGIYSAVRQYSMGDYVATFIGFIGMCIPNFLLALILMYVSSQLLGINVSGLFSPEYAAQPDWTWGKVVDLLKHIWIPIIVVGTAGTAGMIRVMRANLLDELKKPYVVTARAKGVRPFRLLMKYPVRLALNPFISGIGGIFPMLLSGSAIVAIILSLPTVGPLLLSSLMSQDMYMAASLLMIFSLLGVLGTLVSDLLLMWLDPRVRMEGGTK
ncbi:MAG: ABC transporter permease subunit [Opitutales bacterium]|nr:ABC transporter permease subunit [Opitutales bacterium]